MPTPESEGGGAAVLVAIPESKDGDDAEVLAATPESKGEFQERSISVDY